MASDRHCEEKKKDNFQIACLHLYPFKDQHATEKDLQLNFLINRIYMQGSNTEC